MMKFERIQQQSHTISGNTVLVSYDRLTTRFKITIEQEVICSFLILLPIKKVNLLINNQPFTVSIFWFILWKSQLINTEGVVVKELLYCRRRRSIGMFAYVALISSIKIAILLTA